MDCLSSLKPAVYIVGAGPGDPDLLTVKAYKIISGADVIFYANSLVPKQVIEVAKSDAEIIPTGSQTLETVVPLMIERVKSGKSVVRLHSGDLTLYSAIYEQMRLLAEANIRFELVPGIGAYQVAAAKLGVELTVPELVQTIILTRVSGSASPVPAAEDLASLAAHQASLCLYLAARHVETAQSQLMQHYPPDTPVAICSRLAWPDEQIWLVPLHKMATVSREQQLIRTTMYLISPALNVNASTRSRLYDPSYGHLFRPQKNLESGCQ